MSVEGSVPPEFDPVALLAALNDHDVSYVIIGGVAAALHGSDQVTRDLDLAYERSAENVGRLVEALEALEAQRVTSGAEEPVAAAAFEQRVEHFVSPLGAIDAFAEARSVGGFERIVESAERHEIRPGLDVLVIDLESLIHSKSGTGRDKDAVHVRTLIRLREELARRRLDGEG